MNLTRKTLVLAGAALVVSACATGEQLTRPWTGPAPGTGSARDAYAGTVAATADADVVRAWEEASRRALRSGLSIAPSFRERVRFPAGEPHAIAYRFTLRQGQTLRIRHHALDGGGPLFTDVFQHIGGEIFRPAGSAARGGRELVFAARASGEFVLRLQPVLDDAGLYEITVDADAPLLFPVADAGLRDIRSVFGDPRDGGRRRHEGVDIFAPRGTPVLAVSAGTVTRVSHDAIGGRVVWVTDDGTGLSYYYAHLDEQHVRQGDRVNAGDMLGTVGNTGNAITTPPHLHFGVYLPGRVAVDPGPLLATAVPAALAASAAPARPVVADVDPALLGRWARTTSDGVRLRSSPDFGGGVLAELSAHTPLLLLGGIADWHRVLLTDGTTGFVTAESMAVDEIGGY